MNLTPDELKLVEQMERVLRDAGCADITHSLAALRRQGTKPCPFCAEVMRLANAYQVDHPTNGCLLSGQRFDQTNWNQRAQ